MCVYIYNDTMIYIYLYVCVYTFIQFFDDLTLCLLPTGWHTNFIGVLKLDKRVYLQNSSDTRTWARRNWNTDCPKKISHKIIVWSRKTCIKHGKTIQSSSFRCTLWSPWHALSHALRPACARLRGAGVESLRGDTKGAAAERMPLERRYQGALQVGNCTTTFIGI